MKKFNYVEKITAQDSRNNQCITFDFSKINDYYSYSDCEEFLANMYDKLEEIEKKLIQNDKIILPSLVKKQVENGTEPLYNEINSQLSNNKTATVGYFELYSFLSKTYRLEVFGIQHLLSDYVDKISELTNTSYVFKPRLNIYIFKLNK